MVQNKLILLDSGFRFWLEMKECQQNQSEVISCVWFCVMLRADLFLCVFGSEWTHLQDLCEQGLKMAEMEWA